MRGTTSITRINPLKAALLALLLCVGFACSNDELPLEDLLVEDPQSEIPEDDDKDDSADDGESEDKDEDDDSSDEGSDSGNSNCTVGNYIFNETDGLVLVEFENADFSGDWERRTNESGFTGDGYMVWTGSQFLGNPGNGLTTFSIRINDPGTYQFMWRSAVTTGNSGTDHNDTWLRFADADDFFGQKGSSIVYPKGTGKTPNPAGATADGWFKIYRSGSDLSFKWQSSTFDNNGHDVFVTFDSPGVYTMEISARSSGHAIDKFVLFKDSISKSDATGEGNTFSEISCN